MDTLRFLSLLLSALLGFQAFWLLQHERNLRMVMIASNMKIRMAIFLPSSINVL